MNHGHLPDFLDPVHLAPQEKGLQVFFNRGVDCTESLRKSGATDAVKSRFRGRYLDDDQIYARRSGKYGFDISYG